MERNTFDATNNKVLHNSDLLAVWKTYFRKKGQLLDYDYLDSYGLSSQHNIHQSRLGF